MNLQIILNAAATDIFRKQADYDYISARSSFRMQLRQQFLWSAHQAIEKYLKAILLYNGRSARHPSFRKKEFGHDLLALISEVRKIPIFAFEIPLEDETFINYLAAQGANRYLSISAYNTDKELHQLDSAIWHIRRYCQYMADRGIGCQLPIHGMREAVVRVALNPSHKQRPHAFEVFSGELEQVVQRSSSDPARRALVWANLYYGAKKRRKVVYQTFSSLEVSLRDRGWKGVNWEQVEQYIKP